MNTPPTSRPMRSATPAQNRLKPITTARLPVEIVTTMQFAPNHMGNSPRGPPGPCRPERVCLIDTSMRTPQPHVQPIYLS